MGYTVLLQGVEKILERDFFPDLSKMKAQAEYYEALDKNDLVKLRQLQNKFSKRPDTGFSVGEYCSLTVTNLSKWTDMSGQTVQTQIRLLLTCLHHLDALLCG